MIFGKSSLLYHSIATFSDGINSYSTESVDDTSSDLYQNYQEGLKISENLSARTIQNSGSILKKLAYILASFKHGITESIILSDHVREYFHELIFPTTKVRVRLSIQVALFFTVQTVFNYSGISHNSNKPKVLAISGICLLCLTLYALTIASHSKRRFAGLFLPIYVTIMYCTLFMHSPITSDVRSDTTPMVQFTIVCYSLHLTDFKMTFFIAVFCSIVYVKLQYFQSCMASYFNDIAGFFAYAGSSAKYQKFANKNVTKHSFENFLFSERTNVIWLLLNLTGCFLYGMNKLRLLSAFRHIGLSVIRRHGISAKNEESMKWISAVIPSSIFPDYMKFLEESDRKKKDPSKKLMSIFNRSYNGVSILFADIVGFTRMSSNKPATEVVKLLNNLFNQFDNYCHTTGCEKIGTLGDCYYCVAGCPTPRRDHAVCCVKMGLGLCVIIKEFNRDHCQDVNMRIGVHTGRVNAAVIGKFRFRFDVYSYAVIIANGMEATGRPGRVHISEATLEELGTNFKVERGDDYEIKKEIEFGMQGKVVGKELIKTYFVVDTLYPPKPAFRSSNESVERKTSNEIFLNIIDVDDEQEDSSCSINLIRSPSGSPSGNEVGDHKDGNRESCDELLVRSIKDDPEHQYDLFKLPPLHPITLHFVSEEIEKAYRDETYYQEDILTIESVRMAPIIDCLATFIYYAHFFVADMSHHSKSNVEHHKNNFIVKSLDVGMLLICVLFIIQLLIDLLYKGIIPKFLMSYSMRNIRLFVLNMFPIFHWAFYLMTCDENGHYHNMRGSNLSVFAIISSLIVMSGSSWINVFGIIAKASFLIIANLKIHEFCPLYSDNKAISWMNDSSKICEYQHHQQQTKSGYIPLSFVSEIVLTAFITISLVRANDLNLRLCFFATYEADRKRLAAEDASQRTETLLYNIVPKYVMIQLRQRGASLNDAGYAVAVDNVGVTFACICNFFAKYYREDYKGGESALAILNKIICMFDETMEKYKDVEKIKTINDCYMVASGLNIHSVDQNLDQDAHLYNLMDYCFEMLRLIEEFNERWIYGNEKFMVKIGYNIGPVTAGIIGTTKPMYDIWGDTVNVSSRMYSTSRPGIIQCPKLVRMRLGHKFFFQRRGFLPVKGKGDMQTYLCIKRKLECL